MVPSGSTMPFAIDNTSTVPDPTSPSRRVPAWAWALLAFLLGIGLTLWLAYGEKQRDIRDALHGFTMETVKIAGSIQTQLEQCERLIRAFQSVFLASDQVTADEYARAYQNMQTNTEVRIGLLALAYAQRQVKPDGDHFPTLLFAPQPGNEAIRGLDVATQPMNLEALLRSRDSNQVAMSAPFRLVQSGNGNKHSDGFILRLPVYAAGQVPTSVDARRQALVGSIGASFRIDDLLGAAIPRDPIALADVTINDLTDGEPRTLFARHFDAPASLPAHVVKVQFGGRLWSVTAHARHDIYAAGNWKTVLWVGGVISMLLAALTWSLASTRERALVLGTALSQRVVASEERFRRLNELLPCLVLLIRKDNGAIVYRNAVARERLADRLELAGLPLSEPVAKDAAASPVAGTMAGTDIQLQAADGSLFWASTWISSIEIDGTSMWLLVASDNTVQRQLTEKLGYQASHDSLTRLYNRREFEARVQTLLASPARDDGALLFLDLDQFKLINDTSGHRAGDELLAQLAAVMQEKLRPVDVLARLGGDEFGVLLPGIIELESAVQAAERLRRCIEAFIFGWEGRTYTSSASIGVVMLRNASSMQALFTHADAACYLAKEAGRNRIHAYAEDDAAITHRMSEMEWANRVRDALRDDRLLLDYQELHALQANAVGGVHIELLLRLRGEDGGVVLPGAFLPAAERYGLMPQIDRWVVETALSQLDRLHPDGADLANCAINLSAASLEDEGLFDRIAELLTEHRVTPQRVTFEITETVAMRDFAASSVLISRLRGLGCKVALDDFGAGMSSFGYLKNLELDVVKIDGSFVQNLAGDAMSQSIVRAVTEIGHLQGLQVVAEWVSSPQLLAMLAAMQVDYAQGFALHHPQRVCFQRNGND